MYASCNMSNFATSPLLKKSVNDNKIQYNHNMIFKGLKYNLSYKIWFELSRVQIADWCVSCVKGPNEVYLTFLNTSLYSI